MILPRCGGIRFNGAEQIRAHDRGELPKLPDLRVHRATNCLARG